MAEIIDNLEQVIARIKKGAESIESANDVVLKVTEVINVLSTISDSLGVTLKHNESTSGTLLKDTAEMKESLLETVDQVTERLSSLNGLIKASDEDRKKLDGDIASITQLIESNKIEILMAQDTLLKDMAEMKESLLETVDEVTERLSSLNGLIKASDEDRKKLDGDIASITQLIESNKNEILMAQDTLDGDLKKMLNASITGNTYIGSVLENLESLNTNLNIQSKKMTHLEGRLKTFSKMIITLLIVIAGGVYANFGF